MLEIKSELSLDETSKLKAKAFEMFVGPKLSGFLFIESVQLKEP